MLTQSELEPETAITKQKQKKKDFMDNATKVKQQCGVKCTVWEVSDRVMHTRESQNMEVNYR